MPVLGPYVCSRLSQRDRAGLEVDKEKNGTLCQCLKQISYHTSLNIYFLYTQNDIAYMFLMKKVPGI
jgi:hypothetical protein